MGFQYRVQCVALVAIAILIGVALTTGVTIAGLYAPAEYPVVGSERPEGIPETIPLPHTSHRIETRIETSSTRSGGEDDSLNEIKLTSGAVFEPSRVNPSLDNNNENVLSLQKTIVTGSGKGFIPIHAIDPRRTPDTRRYLKTVAEVVAARQALKHSSRGNTATVDPKEIRGGSGGPKGSLPRGVKFHVYQIPDKYIHGALKQLEERWSASFCNRHAKKTNYTMLDWRHAHSLFTTDVLMAKSLQYHPQHTMDPNEADIFVIPMMTHVYNCAGTMLYATEILSWVTQFPYYQLYGGHDHYFFWWRWGMHYNSVLRLWKRVQRHFPNANIISFDFLELMGRNEWQDFSLALKPKFPAAQSWIVMPYPDFSPPLSSPVADIFSPRKVFFYFAGTSNIGGIRRWIKRACDGTLERHAAGLIEMGTSASALVQASDTTSHGGGNASAAGGSLLSSIPMTRCVYQDFGASVIDSIRLGIPSDYPSMMRESVFCGHAAGDALSSRRPTSAVLAGCIPVLICDLCLYAFEDRLDYDQFAVFVSEDDVMNGKLFEILGAIPPGTIRRMQKNLAAVRHHFVYNVEGPPLAGDPLDLLVGQLQRRGALLRSFRRWWDTNHRLSLDQSAYPPDPPVVKRYLRKGISSPKEERNFNNI